MAIGNGRLAIGKETGRRLCVGTNMYPSSSSIVALPAGDAVRSVSNIVLTEPGLNVIISVMLLRRANFQRMKNKALGFMLLLLKWKFDMPPLTHLIVAIPIPYDGTIMTISQDRVKLSPLLDCWKLSEIFTTGVSLGAYRAMMTSISFVAAYDTHFISRTSEVMSHQSIVNHPTISEIYLQVPVLASLVSQTLILVTRSRNWFFVERHGLLVGVFLTAGIEVLEGRKESPGGSQWEFSLLKSLVDLPKHGIVEAKRRALTLSACVKMNTEHKYEIVKCLKVQQHRCGMTKDGVIGIGVAAATDIARSASDFLQLQLQSLMETLNSTEPHYIRCVKPNNVLKPAIFENPNIIQQLRCGGVLEAIRISCAGYPTRRTFDEFLPRFGVLAPEFLDGNSDEKAVCQLILDKMGIKGYQLGKTKVFLRAGQMAELDGRRAEVLGKAARTIQMQICTRKDFVFLRRAAIQLQSCWRAISACNLYEQLRREAAAIKIQKNFRCYTSRVSYSSLQDSVTIVQTGMRAMTACNEFRFKKHTRAAIKIQAQFRCHREYSYHRSLQNAALVTQCGWRARVARKELRKLKMASRETGALKEAKDKTEKKVEELSWRLQFEKRLRTELEETKALEIAKMQEVLHSMQVQVEAARKAIEEAPPVKKETPVMVQDTAKINVLTADIGVYLLLTLLKSSMLAEYLQKLNCC